mgnify:CR=1 FL=1|jgi:hypothetical protein
MMRYPYWKYVEDEVLEGFILRNSSELIEFMIIRDLEVGLFLVLRWDE